MSSGVYVPSPGAAPNARACHADRETQAAFREVETQWTSSKRLSNVQAHCRESLPYGSAHDGNLKLVRMDGAEPLERKQADKLAAPVSEP